MRRSSFTKLIVIGVLSIGSVTHGQSVSNPVLPGAYGGYGMFYGGYQPVYGSYGPYNSYHGQYYGNSRASRNYRRWRARYRSPYLDQRLPYTIEDYHSDMVNYLRSLEVDCATDHWNYGK